MRAPAHFIRALIGDRRGATAVEYGIILAMVVIAMVAALTNVANTTTSMWKDVSDKVQAAH